MMSARQQDLLYAEILFSSVISTPNARFMAVAIKIFFHESEMMDYEYCRIPFKWIPEEIRSKECTD